MPAKGTTYKTGKRNLVISQEFHKKFTEETGVEIDYKTFRDIIIESNKQIADLIINGDDAFKLPENLGYLAVTKYRSNKKPIDWINSRKLKKKVYLVNLHSFNYIYHVKWFKVAPTRTFGIKKVYTLITCRELSRGVAAQVKKGKNYHTWERSDFFNMNKLYKRS